VHHTTYGKLKAKLDAEGEQSLNENQWETIKLYEHSNANFRKNLKTYADMGLTIVSGTDMLAEGAKAAPVAEELALMVEYGMEPLAAIAAGTSNCAKVLGMEGETGILAKGAMADIIVVEGNPSKDIRALEKVAAVYIGGNEAYRK